jgi:hypothetical protein
MNYEPLIDQLRKNADYWEDIGPNKEMHVLTMYSCFKEGLETELGMIDSMLEFLDEKLETSSYVYNEADLYHDYMEQLSRRYFELMTLKEAK